MDQEKAGERHQMELKRQQVKRTQLSLTSRAVGVYQLCIVTKLFAL